MSWQWYNLILPLDPVYSTDGDVNLLTQGLDVSFSESLPELAKRHVAWSCCAQGLQATLDDAHASFCVLLIPTQIWVSSLPEISTYSHRAIYVPSAPRALMLTFGADTTPGMTVIV